MNQLRDLIWQGDSETFEQLIVDAPDLDIIDEEGSTLLIWAVSAAKDDFLRILLKHKITIDVRDAEGDTALKVAAFLGLTSAVKTLLSAGANPNTQSNTGDTALMDAAKNGNREIVIDLINAGAVVNMRNYRGYTALIWLVIRSDSVETAEALIKHGADVCAKTIEGHTALELAEKCGKQEMAATLRACY